MSASIPEERREALLRAETELLLQSPEFVRSPVMSQLLSYLVEQAISNPDKPPKAYQIAVDGLGRSEDFDVQADSYPRVQVGRLRKMLAAHYAARGIEERMRIPIGNYAIEFQTDDLVTAEVHSDTEPIDDDLSAVPPDEIGMDRWLSKRQTILGLAGFFFVIAIGLAWVTNSFNQETSEAIAAPQDYTLPPKIYFSISREGQPEDVRGEASEIELFFENAFASSSQVRLAAANGTGSVPERSQNAYRFESKFIAGSNGLEAMFSLTSIGRDETIWSTTVAIPESAADYPEKLGPITSRIAGIYGVIATDQRKHLPENAMLGYACILRFESYRANRDPQLLSVVDSCINKSLAADPLDSQILAAASYMAFLREEATGRKPDPEAGLQFARRAMVRGREDASANFALARSSFFTGSCARGKEFAEKAVELAPYEASILGQTGAFLFACNDPTAVKYLRRAIALDPRGSILAETALVLTLLAEGKDEEALELAEKIVPSSTSVGPYYDMAMAMVYAKNGRIPESREAWYRLVEGYGRSEDENPQALLRRLIINPALADRAFLLLSRTGVLTKQQ